MSSSLGNIENIFEQAGVIQKGHFLLTSGLHSPVYWEKFRIIEHPDITEYLCRTIAEHFSDQGAQLVVGPTTGGIILAYEVAKQLSLRSVFAEKEDDRRVLRRGFKIKPGEKVLVVDDVLTTGKSVREVLDAVAREHGEVIGIGVLVDRSEKGLDFGIPLFSCLRSATPAYKPEECPLCSAAVPLTKPGGGNL